MPKKTDPNLVTIHGRVGQFRAPRKKRFVLEILVNADEANFAAIGKVLEAGVTIAGPFPLDDAEEDPRQMRFEEGEADDA